MEQELNLETEITAQEAGITGYNPGVDHENDYRDIEIDTFTEVLSASVQTDKEESIPFDYSTEYEHILIERNPLLKILSQISPIIGLNSQRAVSRGVTLMIPTDNSTTVNLVSPNEITYFSAALSCESTMKAGSYVFLDYQFLQKIAKFIPPKLLIYVVKNESSNDKYFIRLNTGDLELVNPQLIDSDYKRLNFEYSIGNVVEEIEPAPLLSALSALSKVVSFESDTNRREVNVNNKQATFISPLVYARANIDLVNMVLKPNIINYMIKAVQSLNSGSKLVIKEVTGSDITRYAICTDNTTMVTNYANPKDDVRINEFFSNVPVVDAFDYSDLKYYLDYANSITYAMGSITFTATEGNLVGKIALSNGSSSEIIIKAKNSFSIVDGTSFKVNTKTFLSALNSLDASLEPSLGYKDGILYITNSIVSLVMITM